MTVFVYVRHPATGAVGEVPVDTVDLWTAKGYVVINDPGQDVVSFKAQILADVRALTGGTRADADAAAASKTAAATSETNAAASAATASTKAGEAASSATAAAGSATSASGSAATATTKAGEAASSATAAAGSASAAGASETNAAGSATAADTAKTAAETARTGAETARTAAQGYAQQAAGSVSLVAWAPATAYAAGDVRQAPDGSTVRRNANGTSGASFDATEEAAWTAIGAVPGTIEQRALSASTRDTMAAELAPVVTSVVTDADAEGLRRVVAERAVFGPTPTPHPNPPTLTWKIGGTFDLAATEYKFVAAAGTVFDYTILNSGALLYNATYGYVRSSANGNWTPPPLGIEFDYDSDDLQIQFTATGANLTPATYFRMWVDDKPVEVSTSVIASTVNGLVYLRMVWPTAVRRRIRLLTSSPLNFRGIRLKVASVATPAETVKLAVLGDSFVEGTGPNYIDTMPQHLARQLGLKAAIGGGQGGTGYIYTSAGGKDAFGHATRINALAAAAPTDVLVFGSSNDNGKDAATIQTAAANAFAALVTALPSVRIHVALPQPTTATITASAAHTTNRDAVRAAAEANANVVTVIDTDAWYTGTGNDVTPAGDGNRDWITKGSDNVHPTSAGNRYWAYRLAEAIGPKIPRYPFV